MVAGLLRGRNVREKVYCGFVTALSAEGFSPPLLTPSATQMP
ncbi:MAG: hypothetical protein ACOY3N_05470 [Bradyrhizobium sp.]|jgi:hypothetical protein|nr:hypothetical protein [Bradyrhizobium japonicum]